MEEQKSIPTSVKGDQPIVDPHSTTYSYPSTLDDLLIYTDGSVLKKKKTDSKGTGGYGVIVVNATSNQTLYTRSKGVRNTTGNRMELKGLLHALQYLKNNNFKSAIIRSDSEYVVNPLSKGWIHQWHKKKYAGKANQDLWEQIYPLFMTYRGLIKIEWVKGHNGDRLNEAADKLATAASSKLKQKG